MAVDLLGLLTPSTSAGKEHGAEKLPLARRMAPPSPPHLHLISFPALSPATAGIQEVLSVWGPLCEETTGAVVWLGADLGAARGHPAASPRTAPGSGRSRRRVLGETSAKINLANPEEWPGAAATLQFQGD